MTDLCKLIQGKFTTPEFRAGITACFHSMGLCPDDRGTFAEFKFTSDAGTLPIAPAGTVTAYPRQANDMTQEEYLDSQLDGDDDNDDVGDVEALVLNERFFSKGFLTLLSHI